MFRARLLLLVAVVLNAEAYHTPEHTPRKSTLELFTQLEPDVVPWWFQRVGDIKPMIPSLNFFGTNFLGHNCVSADQCVMKKLYEGPIFVVTKDPERLDQLIAFYSEKGLTSLFKDEMYKPVTDFLLTPEPKTGLLLNSRKIYNFKIANKPISRIATPMTFKLSDLETLSRIGDEIPLLFITDDEDFKTFKFTYINHFGKFNVFDDIIEPEIK